MGMLVGGLNAIRDLHSTLMPYIEAGTGTDTETAEDTDLQTVTSGTEKTVDSSTTTSQMLKKEGMVPSTAGTSNTITEIAWKVASPEKFHSRVTFTGIAHTNESDIIIKTRWYYKGRK